jgi:MarR family transcriptional regulator, organic hydroperoxide resistance regulator
MHRGHELAMLLRKAYLAFHRRANARIVKSGVTADQFVLLTMLAEEDGITQITIVERTASDPNTVTAMLRLLEQRGLIRRQAHSEDGRARCVFLTGEGKKVQRRLAREADVLLAELWKAVDEQARPTLLTALRQVHDCFSFFSEPKSGGNGRSQQTPPRRLRSSSR